MISFYIFPIVPSFVLLSNFFSPEWDFFDPASFLLEAKWQFCASLLVYLATNAWRGTWRCLLVSLIIIIFFSVNLIRLAFIFLLPIIPYWLISSGVTCRFWRPRMLNVLICTNKLLAGNVFFHYVLVDWKIPSCELWNKPFWHVELKML